MTTAQQLLDRAAKAKSLTRAELVALRDAINAAAAREREAKRGGAASKLSAANRLVRRAERAARKAKGRAAKPKAKASKPKRAASRERSVAPPEPMPEVAS